MNISHKAELKLEQSLDKATRLSNQGMSPNEAITKVAKEAELPAPLICRTVEAFNKSRHVAFLKQASAQERLMDIEVADPEVVLANIYGSQKEAVADFSVPTNKTYGVIEKAAESKEVRDYLDKIKYEDQTFRTLTQKMQKCATVAKAVGDKYKEAVRTHETELADKLTGLVQDLQRYDDNQLQKVARNTVNGYGEIGKKLMGTILHRLKRNNINLEKTANSYIFPASKPYTLINVVCDHAKEVVKNKQNINAFMNKEAKFVTDLAAEYAGKFFPDKGGQFAPQKAKYPEKDLEKELTPEYYNMLKELDLRRNFFDLALYDKDLNKYSFNDLVDAYNSAVSINPMFADKPYHLRSIMLNNLETGGYKDPMTLQTEIAGHKTMQDITKAKEELALKHKEDKRETQQEEREQKERMNEKSKLTNKFKEEQKKNKDQQKSKKDEQKSKKKQQKTKKELQKSKKDQQKTTKELQKLKKQLQQMQGNP